METQFHYKNRAGMTLVELLVAIGLVTLIFGSLIGSFQFMLGLIGSSKAHAGALALANERMEYIRSLEYADVGTISGIPHGPIPQTSTTTINGIGYTERVLIEYIDAEADGEGASDINGILADYKLAKVEYSWDFRGETKTISLISNIVPRGIETTDGGGTLRVNVFDADVLPVAGASVRLVNTTGTTTIDTTRFSNADGVVLFGGAPARAGYEITVTKANHSTDQTYAPSAAVPTPTTLPVAVLESQVSTMNFQIDELSSLTVRTIGEATEDAWTDLFDDALGVASSTDVQVNGGAVSLAGSAGSYSAEGELYSVSVAPGVFDSWGAVLVDAAVPADTSVLVHVYDTSGGTRVLIPDSDLPGNSIGFAPGSIDISSLDASSYTSLVLGATFETNDNNVTPTLLEWEVLYTVDAPVLASIPFSLTSVKAIGTDALGEPVPKYEDSLITNGSGEAVIEDLEWGSYEVEVTDPAYDVAQACENIPYALDPGVDETLTLTLVPAQPQSLRVRVQDSLGAAIPGASVELSRGGYNETFDTTICGQVFFNDGALNSANDYELTVEAAGYTTQVQSAVEVGAGAVFTITLSSS